MLSWLRSWIRDKRGNRRVLWPIRLKWGHPWHWFTRHWYWIGSERCAGQSLDCIPGWRDVFGQTLHLGRLKICFGDRWPGQVKPRDAAAWNELSRSIWWWKGKP